MKTKITNKISTPVLAFLALILFGATNIKAAPGDLDATFGAGGKVNANLPNFNTPRQIGIQPDGKILALGWERNAGGSLLGTYLVRYNPNGTPDTSFGIGGRVRVNCLNIDCFEDGFVIQPDGKILIAGESFNSRYDFAVFRLNADGTRDSTWGINGKVSIQIVANNGNLGHEILVQPDGRVIILGATQRETSGIYDIGIARLNPDGSIDTAFGTNGSAIVVIPNNSGFCRIAEVRLQPDGKFLLLYDSNARGIVRVNADGTLDTAFATGGLLPVTVPFNWEVQALALQPDGNFIVATKKQGSTGTTISRYTPNGTPDNSFGTNGKVVFAPQTATDFFNVRAVLLQPDGKIIIGGSKNTTSMPRQFLVGRLNPNGGVDTSFGTDGFAAATLGGIDDFITNLALQPDGKLVAFGQVITDTASTVGLARYLLNVPRPTSFDFDGDARADISVFRPSDRFWYLLRSTADFSAQQWGLSSDTLAPADYDGDLKTDIAVWRGSEGNFYILNSFNSTVRVENFGSSGDIPLAGDWDADGKADLSVYRAGAQSVFYYRASAGNPNGNITFLPWGITGDKPVAADYDGDGKTDAAIYRNGVWYIRRSSDGQLSANNFGLPNDKLVPADYDGDSKTDQAVYRNGTWYVLQSTNGFTQFQFGIASDTSAPADYDGDGKTDAAVYRDGVWYLLQSTNGVSIQQFGLPNDKPVPTAYLP